MKITLKKAIAVILIVSAILSSFPVFAQAKVSITNFEVKTDNAPIRTEPRNSGRIITRCKTGAVLQSTGVVKNEKGNLWLKVLFKDKTYFIFSGNMKNHSHHYSTTTYENVKFKVCEQCGKIVVQESKKIAVKQANSLAVYAPVAGSIAIADGPIPVGDIVGVAFMGLLAFYTLVKAPSKLQATEIVTTMDFDAFIDKKADQKSCKDWQFQRVTRSYGKLRFVDRKCLDAIEAYIVVKYLNMDVWTRLNSSAAMLANVWVKSVDGTSSCYSERDANQPSYFYHYHVVVNGKKQKAHIFYGANSFGEIPSYA